MRKKKNRSCFIGFDCLNNLIAVVVTQERNKLFDRGTIAVPFGKRSFPRGLSHSVYTNFTLFG